MIPARSSSIAPRLAMLAVAGLLAGMAACSAPAATGEVVSSPAPEVNIAGTDATAAVDDGADAPDDDVMPRRKRPKTGGNASAMNCCAGKNECKGKGNCKTDGNECKGMNECKGLGGCRAALCESEPPPDVGNKMCCRGKNECKGKGNCKTNQHACKGMNNCKALGGCKGPC